MLLLLSIWKCIKRSTLDNQGPMAKAYLARDCGGEEGVIAAIQATPKSAATAVGDRGQVPAPSACLSRLSKALC